LLSGRTGVIDVTAVITAEGANMISTAEGPATSLTLAAETQPKASKRAGGARKRADVAKTKGKSAKKAMKRFCAELTLAVDPQPS
jgi:prophage tail gpP-like protein